ncbi:uncharacterized protein SRS1_11881 [Sporisorium reilianum f. sp. reilianum]|uniref:Uncharacterized protein n=1 Tax=Sporisorium reilianum f. sp. reilianum TaxID=72559 RepID=A0A2N8U8M7_9BASI|nr:uncharacterized protein SRS1_11881 [Sporisorium reilianum f. sp. reilianum]
MAARTVPGAGDKPARRVVPGAPPPAQPKSNKKAKGGASKDAAAVKVPDATSAALIEKAPENPKQVANGLKLTSQDLAEQAEAQAAVAAVDAVQASTTESTVASSLAQKVISDRIAELSSQSKNATISVAVDELNNLLAKVQQAEAASSTSSTPKSDNKAQLVLLLQFLHLFNLFHPNPAGPSTFAPTRTMPPALEMPIGQQVAALAKLYDQLANGPLEGGAGDALEILANIENGSKDEVLEDVSFATVRSMILQLTAPPAATAAAAVASEIEPKASGLDGPPKDFVPLDMVSPSAAPVSFIQASEILDASAAEPEGGQPSTVPATGATETDKGEQGGAGIILGDKSTTSGKPDGTAASAVQEPINTTVKSAPEPKLNWAALAEEDDDDLGEAPVFEPLPSSTTSAFVTPAPGTPTAAEPDATTSAKPAAASAGEAPLSPKPKKGKQGSSASKGGAGARNGNGNGTANGKAAAPPKTPTPKGPKVDEDGFILQESKKTKYLQQKQQQQQRGGSGGRGGKGGANGGRGGRTGGGGARGPKSGEARSSANAGSATQ